jgi:hypothetical protein
VKHKPSHLTGGIIMNLARARSETISERLLDSETRAKKSQRRWNVSGFHQEARQALATPSGHVLEP